MEYMSVWIYVHEKNRSTQFVVLYVDRTLLCLLFLLRFTFFFFFLRILENFFISMSFCDSINLRFFTDIFQLVACKCCPESWVLLGQILRKSILHLLTVLWNQSYFFKNLRPEQWYSNLLQRKHFYSNQITLALMVGVFFVYF